MPRILTDEQIEIVAGWIKDGTDLRSAAELCKETFGIRAAHSTLHSYREIKKAIRDRDALARIETKELLDKSRTGRTQNLITNIKRLERRISFLTDEIERLSPSSKEYHGRLREFQLVNGSYTNLMKEYRIISESAELKSAELSVAKDQSAAEELQRLKDQLVDLEDELITPKSVEEDSLN